jgi:hypothetical protein
MSFNEGLMQWRACMHDILHIKVIKLLVPYRFKEGTLGLPSVRLSVRPSVRPSVRSQKWIPR